MDSEFAAQSMDATKRGGAMANYSCLVIIADHSGKIDAVTYMSPQDGEWKDRPAPEKNGTVIAHLQDGKFVGAEGSVKIKVGRHWALVEFGCPLAASENYAFVSSGGNLCWVEFNKTKHPLRCTIHVN